MTRLGLLIWALACVLPAHAQPPLASQLDELIRHEMQDKGLPSLSVVLVDHDRVVWSKDYGADSQTVYRVGSVSKLFTDIGIMQLVERGQLDLDAPVSRYLPDFHPRNPFHKPITLRQLMSHRSGLVREPPVGHYFDESSPSLKKTVESLNDTTLVYGPETHPKYSNAGIAVVGEVLEETQHTSFPEYLKKNVLTPLGMRQSAFTPEPALMAHLAKARMWTYDGRTFDAPEFEIGMSPAGSMYTTTNDLSLFLRALFAGGGGVIRRETLEQMWTPQFAPARSKTGIGLGFMISDDKGHRVVSHGGAIYGFATELMAMPEDQLGVAVVTTKDCANAVTSRIARQALTWIMAERAGMPLAPSPLAQQPLTPELINSLRGEYPAMEMFAYNGKLYATPRASGYRAAVKQQNADLIVDDVLAYGRKVPLDPATRKHPKLNDHRL